MRIAIDARLIGGTNTGDSTYWTCILESLATHYPQCRFLLLSNRPRPKNVPMSPTMSWQEVKGDGKLWSLLRLPVAARRAGADILHTQYSLSPFAKNGISTIHDVSFFIGPEWFSQRDLSSLKRTIPLTAKVAKRIITVSETSRLEIERFLPDAVGKVRVALNACPPWIQPVDAIEADRILADMGVNFPFVLTVGTNWARKNQELAVSAVSQLPKDIVHKLVVTGKHSSGLKGDRIHPVGYVSELQLSALYSRAGLYLAPSLHEGFGIPLLEAFRCGSPVICGIGGAMPEVVGQAASVVKSYDPDDWSQRIKELLTDQSKLENLRQRGIMRERDFTWTESARQHMRVYEEVCPRLTKDY